MTGQPPPTLPPEATPPPPASSNQSRWLLIGLVAIPLLLLPICCCGGWFLFRASVSSGGIDNRLVGTWKGDLEGWEGWTLQLEFKSSGRFDTQSLYQLGSGRWRVRETEGDKLILEIFYDSEPNRAIGWTIVVNSPDQIDLIINPPLTFKLKRQ